MAFLKIKEACAAKNITLKDLSKLSGDHLNGTSSNKESLR